MLGSGHTEKGETGDEQSQEHVHHLLRQGAERKKKEFVLACQQSGVLHRLSQNVRRLRSELWQQSIVASRHRTVTHFLLHQGILDQNQHDYCPPPALYFSASPIKKAPF
jgi:hypothetical protein